MHGTNFYPVFLFFTSNLSIRLCSTLSYLIEHRSILSSFPSLVHRVSRRPDRYKLKFGVRSFVILVLNKQKVITLWNYTDAVESDVRWSKHSFASTCALRIRGSRKDRYRLLADCDSERRGQRRRIIQREIVDALQRHQRTSVTTDLRASRCSPQRKIRALPEMRSTSSRNVNPEIPPHRTRATI